MIGYKQIRKCEEDLCENCPHLGNGNCISSYHPQFGDEYMPNFGDEGGEEDDYDEQSNP